MSISLDATFKELFRNNLVAELKTQENVLLKAVSIAQDEATHEETRSEGKYDTRAIESGYLAGAQAARLIELQRKIQWISTLQFQSSAKDSEIRSPSFVVVKHVQNEKVFFLNPYLGGVKVDVNNVIVSVVTQESPVGSLLLGERAGSCVEYLNELTDIVLVS